MELLRVGVGREQKESAVTLKCLLDRAVGKSKDANSIPFSH